MKKFIVLVSIVFIFILTSCTRQTDSKTHISFSTWGSKSEIQTIKKVIYEFEKENPQIKIDLIHIPDNYFQKLQLLVASNLSPDVIFINNLNTTKYINAKKIIPLNSYLENSKTLDKKFFFEKAVAAMSKNNNIYAIPRDVSNLVVYYNKTLFDKYNVKYPNNNWSMNEFLTVAKAMTKDVNADGKPEIFGFGFEKNSLFWLPFLWSNGGGILNKDSKSIILDSENSKMSLQFYSDLRNKYHVSPKVDEQSSLTTSQMFLQSKVAMHLCGRWCVQTYKKNADFDWDIAPFPKGKDGSIVNSDTSGWAISSSCKNKDVAWKFIEFLSSDKAIKLMTQDGLILPAKKNIAYSDVFLNPPPKHAKIFIDTIYDSMPTPVCEKYAEMNDIINENLEEFFNGKSTIQKIMDNNFILKLRKL